jgi:hypothetical protein
MTHVASSRSSSLKRFQLSEHVSRLSYQQICTLPPELLRSALVEYCRRPPLPLPDHITNDQVELMSSLIPSLPISPIARVAIDRLPVSLLSHVFTYLDALHDLLDSVRLVSRTWNDIVILPGSCPHLGAKRTN